MTYPANVLFVIYAAYVHWAPYAPAHNTTNGGCPCEGTVGSKGLGRVTYAHRLLPALPSINVTSRYARRTRTLRLRHGPLPVSIHGVAATPSALGPQTAPEQHILGERLPLPFQTPHATLRSSQEHIAPLPLLGDKQTRHGEARTAQKGVPSLPHAAEPLLLY